jgi:long-chain acyl-CoA synthetase
MRPTPDSAFVSIPAIIERQTAAHAGETIMRRKDRGIWKAITWAHLAEQVRRIGGAVLGAQIARGDTAAIISETRPEAAYADLAIQGAGAVSIVVHPEETADRIEHMLRSSGCRLLFVESEEQLDKVLTVREHCPALSRIVIFDMKGLREFSGQGCMSLDAFVSGCPADVNWDVSVNVASPDQPAIVLFPRDETGSPGRTLSHGDVARMTGGAGARLMLRQRDERLAVLRMSDITERIWGLYLALGTGCVSNYLESPETAIENLQELQPTVLGADAEAWAHLHARATRSATAATSVQRLAYMWALKAGRRGGVGAAMAGPLVLHAVRRELGLNRLRSAYVAGAPISAATLDWARSLGITIQQIDEPITSGDRADAEPQPLMQNAHA